MEIVELVGTVVFAVSGVFAVVNRGLDWFGGLVVGIVTAVGGGTIRDVVLGNLPVFWVGDNSYLVAAAIGAVLAIPLAGYVSGHSSARRFEEVLQFADAAGLALFAVVGANLALDLGFDAGISIVAGVVTGVGGGVVRDLLSDRTPLILSGEIYATAALAGCVVYVTLIDMGTVAEPIAAIAGAALIFGLRVLGIRRQWSLPTVGPHIP